MHYIQPVKPDQTAYLERFTRPYRTAVWNAHLSESIAELRAATDQWLRIYNSERDSGQLRPGDAAHISAEVLNRRKVSLGIERSTGDLRQHLVSSFSG